MSGLLNELESYQDVHKAIAGNTTPVDYRQFLSKFGIHLFPNSLPFTAHELREGWAWWNAQPFRNDGYCRHKKSGEFFRFRMICIKSGELKTAMYYLGPSLGMQDAPTQ